MFLVFGGARCFVLGWNWCMSGASIGVQGLENLIHCRCTSVHMEVLNVNLNVSNT